ncbi:hypothetical protein [Methylocapsa sp. S129]|uniref:hypothetical protein n=1 Tax=Methylocapsa sp. S129 TaxID=1641869 RepID=UPI00131B254C|nr:hypothetical protein [Methylocapsa sp. S129]
MSIEPSRLPDAASVETVLAELKPASADLALAPALSRAFPGFSFTVAAIDDAYWRDERTIIDGGRTRLGDHHAWVTRELEAMGGDLTAFWARHRAGDLRFAEWRGASAFATAATGPGTADFVQITLGRESEWRAGPIVDPHYRPNDIEKLLEPTWIARDDQVEADRLAGPVYRLSQRRGGAIVHMRGFLGRCARVERENREARRPELESRVIHEVGPEGAREISFLDAVPGWFDFVPREVRFFEDWERSSASAERIFDHWAFDIRDDEHRGRREVGFIPRPLRAPAEKLPADDAPSVYRLMERVEAVDREIGLKFGWFFLMTHGNWVDPDVGHAIAAGLRAQRVRLPDRDAKVLLRWDDARYLF